MIWNRKEVKRNARSAFKRNYILCVLAALLLAIFVEQGREGRSSHPEKQQTAAVQSEAGIDSSGYSADEENMGDDSWLWKKLPGYSVAKKLPWMGQSVLDVVPTFRSAIVALSLWMLLILLLVNIFISTAFEVGIRRFFLDNTESKAEPGAIFSGFTGGNYGKIVLTLVIRNIKIVLWTLCLIIPGIIKSIEYTMIPYILAEEPELSRKEVFERSYQLMDGNKWGTFVLSLSFIGWQLLGALTGGLLDVLWTNPYRAAAEAELYRQLRDDLRRREEQQKQQKQQNTWSGTEQEPWYGAARFEGDENNLR